MEISQKTVDFFKAKFDKIGTPFYHVVMGSGLASAIHSNLQSSNPKNSSLQHLQDLQFLESIDFATVPGLTAATAPGHKGQYHFFYHKKNKYTLCFQQGRLHGYEGIPPGQVVQTVVGPRLAGCENFILTNAAGGLKLKYPIGSVLVIRDHINLTGQNPLVGPNPIQMSKQPSTSNKPNPFNQSYGPRFPDMSDTYCNKLQAPLAKQLKKAGLKVNFGSYLGLLGPCFETPAEVKLFAKWGLDAVGMSTVWEAIALRYLNTRISGISLISNHACGLTKALLSEEDVLEAGKLSAQKVLTGILDFIESQAPTSKK